MELVTEWVNAVNGVVWGPLTLILILGTGLYLTAGLKFMPIRRIGYAFKQLWQGRLDSDAEGQISPFNALMTSLSATIGTGNIAGVATAITIGGPGALFWMWCTALVGMATKYAEAVLAVNYREVDERGVHVGGPMYYIKNGLKSHWRWLGVLFALFGSLAAFGIGNMVQSHSVATVMQENFSVNEKVTGLVLMVLTALVILGGIKRIAKVAGKLVPFMAITYFAVGLLIVFLNITEVPEALWFIVDSAFTGTAAQGGFAGAAVMLAVQMGVARGIFSNEAGLGSAPIAHAAAKNKDPVNQGTIAMLGTFIDTIIICTVTGLAIVLTGVWDVPGLEGAAVTSGAFAIMFPEFGGQFVSVALALFAFTTILGWSFYGERCAEFLLGVKVIIPFRLFWVAALFIGSTLELKFVWLLTDTLNAMMAFPNLVALLLLSPVVFKLTRDALDREHRLQAD